jgi:sulfur dioxygenase
VPGGGGSYAGLPALTVGWVADHRDALTLLDVRSEAEVLGPDGGIPGSRSALATQQLQTRGLSQVANLRGGLRAWKGPCLPLEWASHTPTGGSGCT